MTVQQELNKDARGENPWSEFVCDLWKKYLPHLREELYGDGMFLYDANTGRYGFQGKEQEEEPTSLKRMGDLLMNAVEENRKALIEEEDESSSQHSSTEDASEPGDQEAETTEEFGINEVSLPEKKSDEDNEKSNSEVAIADNCELRSLF